MPSTIRALAASTIRNVTLATAKDMIARSARDPQWKACIKKYGILEMCPHKKRKIYSLHLPP
jgi:hypothetical protein